jgi:hypothetical protein
LTAATAGKGLTILNSQLIVPVGIETRHRRHKPSFFVVVDCVGN